MATGTEKVIGFIMAAQRPLNEWYLNEGVAWASEAAVLAGIPSGSRSAYMFVNIDGTLYWFLADKATLEEVTVSNLQDADEVAITDAGTLYDATEVEAALAEVMTYAISVFNAIPSGAIQTIYTIDFTAQTTVAARVAAAVEGTDYPTGWVLAASDTTNLLITHNLTGRKIAAVSVFEIDGANERLLVPFDAAYSGILANGLTVLIEGLAPTTLAIRIELIFAV